MRAGGFISICSGIEAISEAWRALPLGPMLYSEIEAFPRAVLEARHGAVCVRRGSNGSGVPLWGDFTALRIRHLLRFGIDLESVDILIGGTPCQAFSMAGLRGGLSDDRGNLSLEFVRLANAIDNFRRARRCQPIIIGWENVEGVLSMPDNAFGCFLAALVGSDAPLVSPKGGKWTGAGLVAGPRRAAAWIVKDAQYFGLAQRRRRVLVVAGARADRVAEILFESEGVRRDTPPRREAGQGITHDVASCLAASGRGSERIGDTRGQDAVVAVFGGNNTSGEIDVAAACNAKGGAGFDASEDGTGRGTPLVPDIWPILEVGARTGKSTTDLRAGLGIGDPGDPMFTLQAGSLRGVGHGGGHAAVALSIRGREGGGTIEIAEDGDLSPAMRASGGGGDKPHALINSGVRRLTPRECERLQGFPDDYTLIDYRGKPAADGPRYRALGNSMPVPMMCWLGERISAALDREW